MTEDVGAKRLCVLKFGSSVLGTEADYPAVALEIYRHVRDGEKVVAVVSALAGETDAQVKRFLVDRYGEFVLLQPRFSAANALLWLAGPLTSGFGSSFICRARMLRAKLR